MTGTDAHVGGAATSGVVHGIRSRVAESEVASPASSSPVQVTAIETVRRLPTMRAVFAQAKIINIVDGACEMRTVIRPGFRSYRAVWETGVPKGVSRPA